MWPFNYSWTNLDTQAWRTFVWSFPSICPAVLEKNIFKGFRINPTWLPHHVTYDVVIIMKTFSMSSLTFDDNFVSIRQEVAEKNTSSVQTINQTNKQMDTNEILSPLARVKRISVLSGNNNNKQTNNPHVGPKHIWASWKTSECSSSTAGGDATRLWKRIKIWSIGPTRPQVVKGFLLLSNRNHDFYNNYDDERNRSCLYVSVYVGSHIRRIIITRFFKDNNSHWVEFFKRVQNSKERVENSIKTQTMIE